MALNGIVNAYFRKTMIPEDTLREEFFPVSFKTAIIDMFLSNDNVKQ